MSIEPVRFSVEVKTPPAKSFELFTGDIGAWWTKGKTIGKNPHVDIVIEPWPEGRWFERDADGAECQWGKVLAWDPPGRLLLGWQLDATFTFDPAMLTEVELTFAPAAGGGTVVTLEHRELQRFGAGAQKVADSLKGGWPSRIQDFADYIQKETAE